MTAAHANNIANARGADGADQVFVVRRQPFHPAAAEWERGVEGARTERPFEPRQQRGHRDGIHSIVAFTIDDGRITRIDFQRNPEKLR